jgi:hypothetical protein
MSEIIVEDFDLSLKQSIIDHPLDAIEFFMPELVSMMDTSREIHLLNYMMDSMNENDVLFDVPVKGPKRLMTCLFVPQFQIDKDIAERIHLISIRCEMNLGVFPVIFVIYTGESENINIYTKTFYCQKMSLKFGSYHLLSQDIDELRRDIRPFAKVMYDLRMAYDKLV